MNLSNLSGGGTIGDAQGQGKILNDDGAAPESLEVVHGFVARRSLASIGAAEKRDFYRLAQKPHSSYEVVVDEASGDLVPLGLERVGPDGTTVLQTAVAAGTGPARSLRWQNNSTSELTNETVRVRSGDCLTTCGPDDVYRVRAYETTFAIPRFNNSSSQITVLLLQNPTDVPINANVFFWNATGGMIGTQPFAVAARSLQVVNASTIPGGTTASGSVTVTSDGRYGELTGKAVALEPATGFSFDSPMLVRQR